MTEFRIQLEGEAELQGRLQRLLDGLEKPAVLLDRIGTRMVGNVQQRFDTKRAPDGTPWLPLSPTTKAIYGSAWFKKRNPAFANGIPGSLLERTRFLRDSLTHNVGSNYVEWGFSDPKAAHHEYGTRRNLPRRQMLTDDPVAGTIVETDRAEILDEVNRYLGELL